MLGHQSITTTQRYTHSSSKQKREAVDLLNSKSDEATGKKGELLHICDMDSKSKNKESLQKLPNHLFSMN